MSIQVTLTFANTEEMLAYFAKPQAAVVEAPAPTPKPKKPAATTSTVSAAASNSAAAPSTEVADPKAAAVPSTPPATPAPAASSIDYATLQKAVVGIATRGEAQRTRVLQIAADMGYKTFKEMPAEQWPAALAEVNKLAEQLDAESEVA